MLIIPKKRNLPLEVIDTIPKSWKNNRQALNIRANASKF
jgi:hypothetical protein